MRKIIAGMALLGLFGLNSGAYAFNYDAKMLLHSAEHNHQKPAAGDYDHARAIAKARAAIGYAQAAEILASK
jgi:hypothetical protein